jgi:DNA-binding MarR family transcriptional regulator
MEEKGLIFKKPDLVDKRSVRIYLTEEGKRKKEISVITIREFNEQVRTVVAQEELDIFFSVFEKIQGVIDHVQSEKEIVLQKATIEF